MEKKDCEAMGNILSDELLDTISCFDYAENYYHGFLTGLLKAAGKYMVRSNRESGNGRPDILMYFPSVRGKAFIIKRILLLMVSVFTGKNVWQRQRLHCNITEREV